MSKNKILYIFGAGSSVNYGLPLGKGLVKNIAEADDKIYVSQKFLIPSNQANQGLSFNEYVNCLTEEYITAISWYHPQTYTSDGHNRLLHILGEYHAPTPINGFKEYDELNQMIMIRQPQSIDRFLKDYNHLKRIGKVGIAYEILKCYENIENNLDDDWYSLLAHEIQDNLDNDGIKVITFNYDMSLEERIAESLGVVPDIEKELITKFNDSIIHVYGKVKRHPLANLEKKIDFKRALDEAYDPYMNTLRYIAATECANDIDIIRKDASVDSKPQIDKYIAEANKIVFIGFGFDKVNLKVLFGANDKGYTFKKIDVIHKLKGKEVFFMNYKGEAKYVSRFLGDVVESTKLYEYSCEKITDFYNNYLKTIYFDK